MRWIALFLSVFSAYSYAADIRVLGSPSFINAYNNVISILPQDFLREASGVLEVREESLSPHENVTRAIMHELMHLKDQAENISDRPEYEKILGSKSDLKESFALDATNFFMDEEFECRRPATAKFFSDTFNVTLKKNCDKNYKVILQSSYFQDNYSGAVSIQPERIYQIHYLFAGKGQELMSRFGHAMFRLVVCAPHRKKLGPECLQDVSHHLALSYRANVTDFTLSTRKGMTGQYPSQLFIMRFLEVQQEYTKFELRDLYSIPLKLAPQEVNTFIDVTLERYWNYQGKYYFLNNNCGTETKKQLSLVFDNKKSTLINSITPHSIYEDIIKESNGFTDDNYEKMSRDEMIERHFLMQSMYKELNDIYLSLKSYMPSFKSKNLKEFLKTSRAKDRLTDYESFEEKINQISKKKDLILKLNLFERYFATVFSRNLSKTLIKEIEKDPTLKSEIRKMGSNEGLLLEGPWQVIRSRYGSPTRQEFNDQYAKFLEKRTVQMNHSLNDQMENLQKILGKRIFSKELDEFQYIQKIKIFTSKLINSLIL